MKKPNVKKIIIWIIVIIIIAIILLMIIPLIMTATEKVNYEGKTICNVVIKTYYETYKGWLLVQTESGSFAALCESSGIAQHSGATNKEDFLEGVKLGIDSNIGTKYGDCTK